MRKQRRFKFRHLAHIRVTNKLSGDVMGSIGDISFGGLRLVSSSPLAVGACYEICLHVPESNGEDRVVEISVIVQWSRRESGKEAFNIGCALDRPSPEFTDLVAHLVARR